MADSPSILVSRELQAIASELEKRLEGVAGQAVGFSLFVWTDGRASYVANVARGEIVPVLDLMLQRWKAQPGAPDVPAHEVN